MDFNWCQFILCPLLELIVFRIGLSFGQLCRNLASMSQNVLSYDHQNRPLFFRLPLDLRSLCLQRKLILFSK